MMTYRQAATLACKVLAIWAMLNAFNAVSAPLEMLVTALIYEHRGVNVPTNYWSAAARLVPFALQITAGAWLWRRAAVVALWMTGQEPQDEADEPQPGVHVASLGELQAVVLSSLGVWVLLTVVPEILGLTFQTLLEWIATRSMTRAGGLVSWRVWEWASGLLLGLWLIFGAPGITRLLRRARGEKGDANLKSQI